MKQKGIVKWFSEPKGFGFISRDGAPDVFVHYKGINATGYKTLHEGDIVEFSLEQGQKGLQAVDVDLVR